jgi:hypothetical protein
MHVAIDETSAGSEVLRGEVSAEKSIHPVEKAGPAEEAMDLGEELLPQLGD